MEEQHIYHHNDNEGARISVKIEKNSRGFNYEASISGAKEVDEALILLFSVQEKLEKMYGQKEGEINE